MGIFQSIFTHLLHVPFYTRLQIVGSEPERIISQICQK